VRIEADRTITISRGIRKFLYRELALNGWRIKLERDLDIAGRLLAEEISRLTKKGLKTGDQRDLQEALKLCDIAARLSPNQAKVWYFKGLALSELGSPDKAIECYAKAQSLDPTMNLTEARKIAQNRLSDRMKPELDASISETSFKLNQWKKTSLRLVNLGDAPATISRLQFSKEVEGKGLDRPASLGPGQELEVPISLKPLELGEPPVDMKIFYSDSKGRENVTSKTIGIIVTSEDTMTAGPPQNLVGGRDALHRGAETLTCPVCNLIFEYAVPAAVLDRKENLQAQLKCPKCKSGISLFIYRDESGRVEWIVSSTS